MLSSKPSFVSATDYCNHLANFVAETQVSDLAGSPLEFESAVSAVVAAVEYARRNQRKAMVIGNGGSASIAAHMQNDLAKSVKLRAMTFFDLSLYTAIANDRGVESVFEEPLQLFADPEDILFAISSSGRSENVLRAVQQARIKHCRVFTLSGFGSENPLRRMGDINFYIPVEHYGMVELAHQILIHCITDLATSLLKN
jgi:D-sedoheptulose 7-phosphate isomerase